MERGRWLTKAGMKADDPEAQGEKKSSSLTGNPHNYKYSDLTRRARPEGSDYHRRGEETRGRGRGAGDVLQRL